MENQIEIVTRNRYLNCLKLRPGARFFNLSHANKISIELVRKSKNMHENTHARDSKMTSKFYKEQVTFFQYKVTSLPKLSRNSY